MKHVKHIWLDEKKQKLTGYAKCSGELFLNLHSRTVHKHHLSLNSGFFPKALLIPCLCIVVYVHLLFGENRYVIFIAEAISCLFIRCLLVEAMIEAKLKRCVIYELNCITLTDYFFSWEEKTNKGYPLVSFLFCLKLYSPLQLSIIGVLSQTLSLKHRRISSDRI